MELLDIAETRFGKKPLATALRVQPNQISVWRNRKTLSKARRAMIEALLEAPASPPSPIDATLQTTLIVNAIRELGEKIDARFSRLENLVEATRLSFDRQRGERMRPRAGPTSTALEQP